MTQSNNNTNGSTDYGVMQINDRWKTPLEKMGIDWQEVRESSCMNIHVGAWVLATNFASHGKTWYAVGAYNAGFGQSERNRRNRLRYVNKVKRAYQSIRESQSMCEWKSE